MKIIADTNIWYELGKDEELFNSVKTEIICPTFVNLVELIKTENIIDKEDYTRQAIRSLLKFKSSFIFEPPLIYLVRLYNDYHYEISHHYQNVLKYSELFANGAKVNHDKKQEFLEGITEIKLRFAGISDLINEKKIEIQNRNINKLNYNRKDSFHITANFVNFCIEIATKKKENLIGISIEKSELLIRTLDLFFKRLETSKMKAQPNDIYDFLILSYVQTGDKYWTKEKRWLNLIKDAGFGNYLY